MKIRLWVVIATLFVLFISCLVPLATSATGDKPVDVTISLSGSLSWSGWYTSAITATAVTIDNGCGIRSVKYSLDGGADQDYPTGGVVVSSEGAHHLVVTATNNYGDTATATSDFKIDRAGPTVTVTVNGQPPRSSGWYNRSVSIEVTGTDTISGISGIGASVSVDGDYNLLEASPTRVRAQVTFLNPGPHGAEFSLTDEAGNEARTPWIITGIDTSAPTGTPRVTGTTGAHGGYLSPVSVDFSTITDTVSGLDHIDYTVDGVSGTYTGTPTRVTGDGSHQVTYQAYDKASNCLDGTLTINIEKPGPVMTISMSELGYGRSTSTPTPTLAVTPTPSSTQATSPTPTPTAVTTPTPAPVITSTPAASATQPTENQSLFTNTTLWLVILVVAILGIGAALYFWVFRK